MTDHSLTKLLRRLQEKQLISEDASPTSATSLWYVSLMQGFAGWLAALFMLGFVGTAFTWLFRYDNELLLIVAGLGTCVAAYLIQRSNLSSVFIGQLAIATSLCGQLMVAWSLFDLFDFREIYAYLALGIFQAVLAILMPNYLHRVLSSWFSVIAFSWLLHRLGIFGLGTAVVASLFIVLSLKQDRWARYTTILQPILLGLAISLIQVSSHSLFGTEILSLYGKAEISTFHSYAPYLGLGVTFLSYIYLLSHIFKRYAFGKEHLQKYIFWSLALLFGLASLPVQGVTAALLVLIAGFYMQRITLTVLGLISIICFFSWYYYSLHETLLIKSIWLGLFGTLLIIILMVVKRVSSLEKKDASFPQIQNRFTLISIISILLFISLVNLNIYSKENLLKHGQTVSLELAPVDPRSLMQGDYMRLRFAITREIFGSHQGDIPADGFIVVRLDEQHIGRYVKRAHSAESGPGELALQYRIRQGQLHFATNAFFFEEGSAHIYDQAKYGLFKVAPNGEMLLLALQDEEMHTLGLNQP